VLINEIVPGSPADQGGLQVDDTITALDGTKVTNTSVLATTLDQYGEGAQVTISYTDTQGASQSVEVTLGDFTNTVLPESGTSS
jgi:S1-C subfamily serine protease